MNAATIHTLTLSLLQEGNGAIDAFGIIDSYQTSTPSLYPCWYTKNYTHVTYFIWLAWFMFKKHAGGQMYGEENRASSLRGTRWHEESVAGPRDVHPELQYVPLGAEGDMNMDDQRPSWIWFDPYCMIWVDVRVIQFFTIRSQLIVLETPSHLATCEYYLLSILGRK